MSSFLSSLLGFFKDEEKDDVTVLPEHLRDVYLNPSKVLNVPRDIATPSQVREAFRVLCLHHNPEFIGFPWTRNTFEMVVLAFRMLTGELKGPARVLAEELKVSPLFHGVVPRDILHTLRPLTGVNPCFRASKMLAVRCAGTETGLGKIIYEIEVSYCMRISRVKRTQDQFEALYKCLARELVLLPVLPEGSIVFGSLMGSGAQARGAALCRFLQQVHNLLGQRGVFSPRLMAFLGVDYARVHIEEEGRLVKEHLDSTNTLPNTCWQVVEETWMVRWRKFIQGHGARRYLPPPPISNHALLRREECGPEDDAGIARLVPVPGLKIGHHYRVVNYNVWQYWMMVYGGGPNVGRKRRDIYSSPAIAQIHAIKKAQAVVRGYLARRLYRQQFLYILATQHAGAKELLYERSLREAQKQAEEHVMSARHQRNGRRVVIAAKFTQAAWRAKKGYAYQDEKLQLRRHFQQVFEKADNTIKEPKSKAPMVVAEIQQVLNIGGAEEYNVEFEKSTGLTIGLRQKGRLHHRRRPNGGGLALSEKVPAPDEPEVTEVFSVPDSEKARGISVGSILLSVNRYPVTPLSHQQTMIRIQQASWPLTLRFSRPLVDKDVLKLRSIAAMRTDDRLTDEVVLEHIKRRLLAGIGVWRFGLRGALRQAVRMDMTLSIDQNRIYYSGRDMEANGSPTIRFASLYDLKHVTVGKGSSALEKGAKGLPHQACFTVFLTTSGKGDYKALDLAVKDGLADGAENVDMDTARNCRDALVWGLRCMIEGIRAKQTYMDKDGTFKTRRAPKQVLRSAT
jgi:hypothetical protein